MVFARSLCFGILDRLDSEVCVCMCVYVNPRLMQIMVFGFFVFASVFSVFNGFA